MRNAIRNRLRHRSSVVAVVALALAASAVSAGVNTWTALGPEGGNVRTLAIDPVHPSAMYAGTSGGGVFKSTDAGERWTALNAGLTHLDVNCLVVDPAAPATLYAATAGEGVFRSSDGGQSWTAASTGLVSPYVNSLAIGPSGLYAGTENFSGGFGVYKSTDRGETWTAVNAGLSRSSVTSLAIDPNAPETVYAGTYHGGVYRSIDGGQSWTKTSIDMGALVFNALAIDPSRPATLYAATYAFDYPPDGIFKSTDGGAHWEKAIGPNFRNRSAFAVALDPSNPSKVYAGTSQGLAKSSNGGVTWRELSAVSLGVGALAISPSAPATIYAGTSGGVFRSSDGGVSLAPANAGLIVSDVHALAIDPSTPATLYAGTYGSGVSKSLDGGGSWAATNTGLTTADVDALVVDPSVPATLYAGTQRGVFKSRDGGDSWTAVNSGLTDASRWVSSLAIHPMAPGTIYAGTFSDVFESTNGGESWAVAGALPASWHTVYGLVLDPSAPATLYALTNGGVFKSVDGAVSWTESLTDRFVWALTVDPFSPATLYAASVGVFKSIDGGEHWSPTITSPANTVVTSLVIDPETAVLYAAGHIADRSAGVVGGGVFKSTDGGESWEAMRDGLTTTEVRTILLDPSTPARLYAATNGGGVFQRSVGFPACSPSPTRLCLVGNRYAAELLEGIEGGSHYGPGTARPLGDRAGYFAFPSVTGDTDLPEVVVKMLADGAFGAGGAPVFYSSLTTLPYVLTVTDTLTGRQEAYASSPGAPLCGGADLPFREAAASLSRRASPVAAGETDLRLLGGRFSVTLEARIPDDPSRTARGVVMASADRFGFFSLPQITGDAQFPEVVVKMVDARSFTGKFWFFYTGMTGLDYTLSVVDSVTGASNTYESGASFCGSADTRAFTD